MKFRLWECAQGSEEWHGLRMGIPTASAFDRVIQPSKMGYAAAAEGYACELAIERLLGESNDPVGGISQMERGKMLEPHAIAHYEVLYGTTAKVGFISDVVAEDDPFAVKVTTPNGPVHLTMGCSPDAILAEDVGGLELKCPMAHTHAKYMVSDDPGKEYICQIQGSMMITGFEHWDFMSYHPGLPEIVFRYHRDEKFIATLRGYVNRLLERVEEICERIKAEGEVGYGRTPRPPKDMNLVGKIVDSQNWGG